ncbi:hypothetical protein Q8W40_02185 [Vibrio penaeicida]|uniref:hypothetical protein n=1 Tax=Vibrio penaeicida TaxID=104609 RepID=UPI002732922F|nr:hypothetical protein [Vibrio penaeicida]MDP2570975.1 hypothetical protein [Vibrio penaeicida]
MEVSYGFESFQSMFSFITDSGFSQEDLVSNLIGFYIGIGEVNRLDALRSCEPTTDKLARIIWDNEGAVGSNKNRKWNPKYASSTYVETIKQCMDECLSETKELPPKFKRIKPSIKGLHHQELKLM